MNDRRDSIVNFNDPIPVGTVIRRQGVFPLVEMVVVWGLRRPVQHKTSDMYPGTQSRIDSNQNATMVLVVVSESGEPEILDPAALGEQTWILLHSPTNPHSGSQTAFSPGYWEDILEGFTYWDQDDATGEELPVWLCGQDESPNTTNESPNTTNELSNVLVGDFGGVESVKHDDCWTPTTFRWMGPFGIWSDKHGEKDDDLEDFRWVSPNETATNRVTVGFWAGFKLAIKSTSAKFGEVWKLDD